MGRGHASCDEGRFWVRGLELIVPTRSEDKIMVRVDKADNSHLVGLALISTLGLNGKKKGGGGGCMSEISNFGS